MVTIIDDEFVEINVAIITKIAGALPFDVYVRRGENTYTKIFLKGDPVDLSRLEVYSEKKGVYSYDVHRDDYRQYLLYVEQIATNLFTNKTPDHEIVANVVKEMANLTMMELVVNKHVDTQSIAYAATTIKGCIDALTNDSKSLFRVFRLLSRHPYMIKHALTTAVFALLLARADGLESPKSLMTLGLAALLHDIGMAMLTFDPESKDELTPDERKEIYQHPELAKRMLDSIKVVTPEVRATVMQHHEQPNGRGYPNGLHDQRIFHLAKIVAIADSFSALISVRPYRSEAFTPIKALEVMNEDRGKFDLKLLQMFCGIFITTKG